MSDVISQEVNIEIREKLADGTYKKKNPATKAALVKFADGTTVEAHKADNANPHAVTKTQVGLGSVENYGIATQAEAQAGTSNIKHITPLRVKEAIDANVVSGSYTGTGTATRNINIGFTPRLVLIIPPTTSNGGEATANFGMAVTGVAHKVVTIITDGFTVYQDTSSTSAPKSNTSGQVFRYLALK